MCLCDNSVVYLHLFIDKYLYFLCVVFISVWVTYFSLEDFVAVLPAAAIGSSLADVLVPTATLSEAKTHLSTRQSSHLTLAAKREEKIGRAHV